jgi:hypothetical protein
LAPEHSELMAKHEDLDVVVSSFGRAGRKGNKPAKQQVDESQEHGSGLPSNGCSIL